MKRLLLFLIALLAFSPLANAQLVTRLLTNNSGVTIADHSVVIVDSAANSSFKTTTTQDYSQVLGVLKHGSDVTNGTAGSVMLYGIVDVLTTGSVTRGDYLATSATAGKAESNTTNPQGSFAIALTSGTDATITCMLIGPVPNFGGTPGSFSSIVNTGTYTGSGALTTTIDDSGTNTVVTVSSLFHTSTGTPASGLGAKLRLGAEDSAGNSEVAAEVHGYLSTVTNGAEVGVFKIRLVNAGALQDAIVLSPTAIAVTGSIGMTGDLVSTQPSQWLIQHAPGSGNSAIRFSPVTGSATDFANVDFFRTTNVNSSSANGFRIYKGDNTATVSVTIQNNPSAIVLRDSSGTAAITMTGSTGNATLVGDIAVNGDDITSDGDLVITPAGSDTSNVGTFTTSTVLRSSSNVTFTANDTTPTVSGGNMFTVPGTWTAANNITALDDGATGQVIRIIGGDSDCVMNDASTLVLNGAWTAAANATITLVFNGTNWLELCRSAN